MKKKTNLFLSVIFLFQSILSFAQKKDELAIREILINQTEAWNSGELDSFMKGCWQNDSLKFIGNSGITYGWKQTLENYKNNYPDTAAMGKLTFDILKTERLSALYFFVIGKWHLTRSIGDLNGYFTLLFKKKTTNGLLWRTIAAKHI